MMSHHRRKVPFQMWKNTHTHIYTYKYIYDYICACTHVLGYCIVTLAGRWRSNMYEKGMALWANAKVSHGVHFFVFGWCNISPRIWIIFSCLYLNVFEGTLSGSFWVQDSSNMFFFQRGMLHSLKVSLKSIAHWASATSSYANEHKSHDTTLLNKSIYDSKHSNEPNNKSIPSSAAHFRGMFHHVSVFSQGILRPCFNLGAPSKYYCI